MSYQAFLIRIGVINGLFIPPVPVISLSGGSVSGSAYEGVGIVSGTVKNVGSPGIPVHRKVRLYEKNTGSLVRETWSDAVTGAYVFKNVSMSVAYSVSAFDHTGKYNAVIADPIYASLPS